jgi:hypothetical protein
VIVVLIVLGFDLDAQTQQLLLGLSAALGAALPISDAVVRHGRASNIDKIAAVKAGEVAQDATTPPPPAGAAGAPASAGPLALTPAERRALRARLRDLA